MLLLAGCETAEQVPKIGVIYVFHGGADNYSDESSWNATMQIFSYDPHSTVYQRVIWNPKAWPALLRFGNAPKERGKYTFEHERIVNPDPANRLTRQRFADLRAALKAREAGLGVEFVVDYASWLATDPTQHIYPRAVYRPGVEGGAPVTYCGGDDPWPDCSPSRYDTDGTMERMLAAGVDEIVMIDMTTSGVRFFKSFDVVNLARRVAEHHAAETGKRVLVHWANDPTDLMTESYPDKPFGWTRSLGPPERDRKVPLAGRPNPVASHPRLAELHADGIEAAFSPSVPAAETGVLLVNHATRLYNQTFDPKIDDTVILNRNIRQALLERHPNMNPGAIVGGWMGMKEPSAALDGGRERTRAMRGENLGDAWLYESDRLPAGEWGFRYWEALAHLRDQGVRHIVVAFPQIMVDSVLNLVEVPNQIAKEIGTQTWLFADTLDFERYPEVGHPFADYWGIWVDTECAVAGRDETEPCCFEMGGCADGRPYPPPRQTPANKPRDDLDPSLAFDVSAFGHIGYAAANGPPNAERPVQAQYAGTWAMWQPPNDDPEAGQFLADRVIELLQSPRRTEPLTPADMGAPPL